MPIFKGHKPAQFKVKIDHIYIYDCLARTQYRSNLAQISAPTDRSNFAQIFLYTLNGVQRRITDINYDLIITVIQPIVNVAAEASV
jgi:hypothetical protein